MPEGRRFSPPTTYNLLPTTYPLEGPLAPHSRSNQIGQGPDEQHTKGKDEGPSRRSPQHVEPSENGDDARHGIEPHSKRPLEVGRAAAQQEKTDSLRQVLDQHARGDQAGDDLAQLPQTEDGRHNA